jgi:hypothetical protein
MLSLLRHDPRREGVTAQNWPAVSTSNKVFLCFPFCRNLFVPPYHLLAVPVALAASVAHLLICDPFSPSAFGVGSKGIKICGPMAMLRKLRPTHLKWIAVPCIVKITYMLLSLA